ncbi:MAG: hypothetical protein M3R68_04455 [Acidobacteriota bacterium]|nr:hypothetical protein [Acidobacteriota bacterium]
MKKNLFMILMTAVICASSVLRVRADQPRMQAAKVDLENALKSLNKASADKGGHREKAMNLISKAITAVNQGIEYDRSHFTPGRRHDSNFNEEALRPANATPDQPHMMAARDSLNNALGNLNRASADKGGYREQAIGFVREAISEVNAGISFDRRH